MSISLLFQLISPITSLRKTKMIAFFKAELLVWLYNLYETSILL